MKKIILVACVMALIGSGCAFSVSGNYTGSGEFSSRCVTDGDVAETRGDGTVEMGITAGNGISWTGYNFAGTGGMYRMYGESGPLHSVLIYNASVIEAQMQIDPDQSWVELAGNGTFEEEAYEADENGRPQKVLDIGLIGAIQMDNTVYNDAKVTLTTDITEADK